MVKWKCVARCSFHLMSFAKQTPNAKSKVNRDSRILEMQQLVRFDSWIRDSLRVESWICSHTICWSEATSRSRHIGKRWTGYSELDFELMRIRSCASRSMK